MNTETLFMPQGQEAPNEAQLKRFGPIWLPKSNAWTILSDWWLAHAAVANTPNWDIAIGCLIENRPGLILVEAKANWPELNVAGKSMASNPSIKSRENHEHIGDAIRQACDGWQNIDERVAINRDSHYQLANRLAFTWKLATLGIPVVLLYLGFTGDEGIRDAGKPFSDENDWQQAFKQYSNSTAPLELFGRRLVLGSSPVWLMSKSRAVLESSPPIATKVK